MRTAIAALLLAAAPIAPASVAAGQGGDTYALSGSICVADVEGGYFCFPPSGMPGAYPSLEACEADAKRLDALMRTKGLSLRVHSCARVEPEAVES